MNNNDTTEPIISHKDGNNFGLKLNRAPQNEEEMGFMWEALSNSFAYMFGGNPSDFILRRDDGGYHTVHRAPSMLDWMAHLCGYPNRYMVSIPLRPDGTVYWAAIDVDRKEENAQPVDWPQLARTFTLLKLPLIVVRSSGGKGAHLFCFFREQENPILASDAIRLMKHYAELLGLPADVEIFPKQVSLGETAKGSGSGISVPYRLGTFEVAFDADGQPIEFVDDFLDFCWERCFFGGLLIRDLPSTEAGPTVEVGATDDDSPRTIEQIRGTYQKHMDAFRAMKSDGDHQNDQLNVCSLMAARGHMSMAFEQTEDQLKSELRAVATSTDYCKGIEATITSGWNSGIAKGPYKIAPARVILTDGELMIPDLSEDCLDGWLGEVCATKMGDFPRAWAWPSLLAAASVGAQHTNSIRSNLYVALVGAAGSGRSSVIEVANWLMGLGGNVISDYIGSAEGLSQQLPKEGQAVLWSIDELAQMLDKAKIDGASFVRVLCTAFYRDSQALVIARGKKHAFDCKLSIIGGIVDEEFEDAFSAITAHGFYDRFIFGYGPTGFRYKWHPRQEYGESLVEIPMHCTGRKAVRVESVNGDVWEFKNEWLKNHEGMNREAEIALRCALIAASWDGRRELRADDLAPSFSYAEVQGRVRMLLKPNMGKNQSGEVSQKILDYLKRVAPNGEWIRARPMLQKIHAFRYGSDLVNKILNTLSLCGEIEQAEDKSSPQKPKIVRWITAE